MKDSINLKGVVRYKLFDENGNLKQEGQGSNIVTYQGATYFVEQLTSGATDKVKLIALGTGSDAVGTADTWVSGPFSDNGSADAGKGTVEAVVNAGTPNNIQYIGTFEPGYATENGITRAILTNLDPSNDGKGTPNGSTTFCVAHGTVAPTVNKGSNDTLVITWDIALSGS